MNLDCGCEWSLENYSIGHSRKDAFISVNLDFDAKVPIPFSVFPSSYRSDAVSETETTRVRVAGEANLPPEASRVGREGHETRYSSFEASLPGRKDRTVYDKEEVKVYEEDRSRRPRRNEEDITVYEERDRHRHQGNQDYREHREYREYRDQREHYPEVEVTRERFREEPHREFRDKVEATYDIEVPGHNPELDITERSYRQRVRPTYDVEYERRAPQEEVREVKVEKETTQSKMGYYDDSGRYHSFRDGLERAADRVLHPFHPHHHHRTEREETVVDRDEGPSRVREGIRENVRFVEHGGVGNSVTIPCHFIRIGDLLLLQGRPCQVIRITTSSQTGQHRYLGVDLFTKQLHEESSFISNPAPSVVVQNMYGPVFKQYRILDIRDDGRVVAMTETGDVKQALPVIDQGGLWKNLNEEFNNGRGSVRVLVINDGGRELAVDYKVIHGARL
ncbi:hypothetical protein MMC14_007448 [Varicellaria rhodocarpa]|nr:hypothetical protein [Varicellaria rhodocarpa]